jgi:general secretion pathway protein D
LCNFISTPNNEHAPTVEVTMRALILILSLLSVTFAHADEKKIDFNYKSEDIRKVVADYAKVSGQKFILDPQVRGIAIISNPGPITIAEAFNELSRVLAINGLAIVNDGDTMVILQARAAQRDHIELVHELPPAQPQKMYTWVVTLQYASADEINKQLRILTSKDGELVPFTPSNSLIISDYSPNLHRIAEILKDVDVPKAKDYVPPKRFEPICDKPEKTPGSDKPHFHADH